MASSNLTAWKPAAPDGSHQPETSKLKHLIESQQFTLAAADGVVSENARHGARGGSRRHARISEQDSG